MSLGNNIKKYRRDLGMTQEELAGILCITSQAVSKWESGAGMPDVTQIVPLAKALNVSTDALFGFSSESYDVKLTEEILHEADALQESGDPAEGALAAAEYLDQKCEEHIFNYRIMTRYVQAIGHLSRFVNQNNSYYEGILSDDKKRWKQMVRSEEKAKVVREFGVKAAENMAEYTREYIEAKKKFMLGQLKSWSDEAVFAEFEKRI